ncbi:MAG: hypothetical protein QM535_21035 [Limnohabitans sp.]|nr:hypothetical protein [Limnohabitans sp.]
MSQTFFHSKENVFKLSGRRCLYAIKHSDTIFIQSSVIDQISNTFFIDSLISDKKDEYSSTQLIAHQNGSSISFSPNKDTVFYVKYFCNKQERRKGKISYQKVFNLITNKEFDFYLYLENGRLNNKIQNSW